MTDSGRMWIMCGLSMCIGAGIVFVTRRHISIPTEPQQLNVALENLLPDTRFPGISAVKTPTLIEFLDYQCPPCRKIDIELSNISKSPFGLRRIVRHLPLRMHSQAMPAAILAEEARIEGKFDQIHTQLMQSSLDSDSLKKLAFEHNIPTSQESIAKTRISQDIEDAKKIGITGTPTMILCLPGNKTYRIQSISEIRKLML